jgi:stage IV sporulation protein B
MMRREKTGGKNKMKKYRIIILFALFCASLVLPPKTILFSFPASMTKTQADIQSVISLNSLVDFFNHQNYQPINSNMKVIPGGQSIGITLRTNGVLIVGYAPIIDSAGKQNFPAKVAGVKIGDIILSINDIKAQNDLQVPKN